MSAYFSLEVTDVVPISKDINSDVKSSFSDDFFYFIFSKVY